jgi:hypothetical protein
MTSPLGGYVVYPSDSETAIDLACALRSGSHFDLQT